MTDSMSQLDEVIELAGRLGIQVRHESLAGTGGGLCLLRGRRVLFIDTDTDVATQLDQCLAAIAEFPELDETFLRPAIRERIDRYRAGED